MIFRSKFGQLGPGKGQFNSPHGFCLGMDEDIVVADTNNHRIQIFEKTGDFKYQFGQPGQWALSLCHVTIIAYCRLDFLSNTFNFMDVTESKSNGYPSLFPKFDI